MIRQKTRNKRRKDKKDFGDVSSNLLDYSYPSDLFDIIFGEWNVFSQYFKKDHDYWTDRKRVLSMMRRPVAHNREIVLPQYIRKTAEGYCQEILDVINNYT